MLKKSLLSALLLVAACSQQDPGYRYCPNVTINPEFSHITRFFGEEPQFRAEIVGYEGYCRYNAKIEQTNAVIAPVFEIARLSDIGGKNVEITYYANTSSNPDKLMGRQPHSFHTTVETKGEKILVTGDEITVRIPNNQPGYNIVLEMALSRQQHLYNKKQGLAF